MPDREYVIKCLKYLHDRETWKEGPLVSDDHAEDRRRITADALALLREQEAVEPKAVRRYMAFDDKGHPYIPQTWDCGYCGMELEETDVFCRQCGRKVKWDG